MESGSDWDSLSGDEDIEPPSLSIAANPPQKLEKAPTDSPLNKNPLSRTDLEPRAPPRTAESYRNILNRGNVQGITSFKDRGDIDDASQRSTPTQQGRGVHTPVKHDVFKEIEMKENATAQNITYASSSGRQKKRSMLIDSNENLPYTEFEATDMPPRRKDESLAQSAMHNRARDEYIVASPAPEYPTHQTQETSIDSQQRYAQERREGQKAKAGGKKARHAAHNDDNDDDVIVNKNVPDPIRVDGKNEPASKLQRSLVKYDNEDDIDDVVVFKSAYDRGRVEERFLYEDGIRDYYSTYAGTTAKMPLLADRIENYTKRGVQEFFGALQIVIDFIVIFFVELARFLFRQFGRKLLGGIITVFGDSFLKPLLAASFNNIIQPLFVLVWNMMHVLRKLAEPVLLLTREIFSQFAMLLRSLRLVDWVTSNKESPDVKNV